MEGSSFNLSIQSRILFLNSVCVVINKLKGEAAQGAKEGIVNLPKELKTTLGRDFVQAVHRIDVPVTGCVLFASDKAALSFLYDAFAGKNNLSVEKIYWAIIEKPEKIIDTEGKLTHWIEINSKINKSFAYKEEAPGRKKAVLGYKIIGQGDNYLFAEINLLSGRHHQIRAQLAAVGFFIKGDTKYGARRSEKTGGIRLHARLLSFPNPLNKSEKVSVTADPPEMDNLWKAFVKE